MLSVVHVIDNLIPGGTEKQCVELVRGLERAGIRNTVFHFAGGPLLRDLQASGADVRYLAVGAFASPRFPARVLRLARDIRKIRPDVVQTYGFYSNLPGLLAAAWARVPVRIAGRRDLGDQRTAWQRAVDRLAYGFAHRVVGNSDAVRRRLIEAEGVAPAKIVVIRNGVDVGAWRPRDEGATDGPVVGMVAHFRAQKDHMTFLRAAREVLAVLPSVRFCLVGSGDLEPDTRRGVDELGLGGRVEFLGRLTGEALRAAVRRFDVSVLTSKDNEGLPNAVLESMIAGVPVVATPVGGTPEAVEDGVTGFLVPPRAPSSVAERVLFLLKEPSTARAMGERGRAKIEREFTIARMVAEFQSLYHQLTRNR
ncbi:MAG TPA: glycosyltransferase [Methylomirabilota bacterium]